MARIEEGVRRQQSSLHLLTEVMPDPFWQRDAKTLFGTLLYFLRQAALHELFENVFGLMATLFIGTGQAREKFYYFSV